MFYLFKPFSTVLASLFQTVPWSSVTMSLVLAMRSPFTASHTPSILYLGEITGALSAAQVRTEEIHLPMNPNQLSLRKELRVIHRNHKAVNIKEKQLRMRAKT